MSSSTVSRRVAFWGVGHVGRQAVGAVALRPHLIPVAWHVRDSSRVGTDLGEFVGGSPLGVLATDTLQGLLAAQPDVVLYTPLHANVDELCSLLEAGVNVITTAGFLSGLTFGAEDTARLEAAAQAGGASMMGTGMNPGVTQYLAGILAGMTRQIHKIRVVESFDLTAFAGDPNMDVLGFGDPVGERDHTAVVRAGTGIFGDGVEVLADLIGVELDDVVCEVEVAKALEDLDLPGRFIPEGGVAGIDVQWSGLVDGEPVIEVASRWVMGRKMEPKMRAESAYFIDLDADPRLKLRLDILPYEEDFSHYTLDDFQKIGMVLTAAPVVNAIDAICDAQPGLTGYAHLPVITSRGVTAPRTSA